MQKNLYQKLLSPDGVSGGAPPAAGNALAADPNVTPALVAPQPNALAADDDIPQTGLSQEDARKLRSEASNLRKRLKEFEAADAAAKEAALSETEKLTKRLAEVTKIAEERDATIRSLHIDSAIREQAAVLGITDTALVKKLLQPSEVEFGEDGQPKNLAALLNQLIKDHPALTAGAPATPPRPQVSPSNPSRSASSGALTQDIISRMRPEEYAARKDEIYAWLRQQR